MTKCRTVRPRLKLCNLDHWIQANIPADITIAYRPLKTNTTAVQRTCKGICFARLMRFVSDTQLPFQSLRQRREIIRASLMRMVHRTTWREERLHCRRPEAQGCCGKFAMVTANPLRACCQSRRKTIINPAWWSNNHAWTSNGAGAWHRKHDRRSVI